MLTQDSSRCVVLLFVQHAEGWRQLRDKEISWRSCIASAYTTVGNMEPLKSCQRATESVLLLTLRALVCVNILTAAMATASQVRALQQECLLLYTVTTWLSQRVNNINTTVTGLHCPRINIISAQRPLTFFTVGTLTLIRSPVCYQVKHTKEIISAEQLQPGYWSLQEHHATVTPSLPGAWFGLYNASTWARQ